MRWRTIDLADYPRRAHFDYFRTLANPMMGLTVNVDVAPLRDYCRGAGCSFYLAFTHVAALAADGVPQLRQRIRDGGIVEYDACDTSHVELLDDGTYCYCTLSHHMPWPEYLARAAEARRRCRERAALEEDEDVEGMYFVTSIPWLHYAQLIQPTAGGDESNPRISWGRFEDDGRGRLMMPLTLMAHHALVDGLQAAQFYRNVEEEMKKLPQ